MSSTSKILVALLVLALLGGATYFLSQSGPDYQPLDAPLAGSTARAAETASAKELAAPAPDAQRPAATREESRTAVAEPVVETDEEKRARARAQGPWLKGRVVDLYGNPVRDAVVEVSSWQASAQGMMLAGMGGGDGAPREDSRNAVKTDDSGKFAAFRRDNLGLDVAVSIAARGFLVAKQRKLLGEDGTLDLGDFRLEPGVVLVGTAVDENGQPVEGVRVKRLDNEGAGIFEMSGVFLDEMGFGALAGGHVSDAEGRFELPYEEPGPFRLSLEHEAHPKTIYEGESPPAGAETIPFVVRLNPGATIAGRLEKLPAERENVHVYARAVEKDEGDVQEFFGEMGMFAGANRAEVSSTGDFVLRGLQPGAQYELRAVERGGMFMRKPCSETVRARAGDDGIELTFDPGASLTFRVVDSRTGEPLTHLEVKHYWADGSDMFAAISASFTGGDDEEYPDGRVVISELRPKVNPGKLELRVTSPGYLEYARDDVQIPVDAEVDLGTIRLRVAPKLRVRVLESLSGEPIPRARVRVREAGGLASAVEDMQAGVEVEVSVGSDRSIGDFISSRSASGKTDADGWCEIPAFETDSAILSVNSPKYSDFEQRGVQIAGTGTTTFTASLLRGGEVEAVVVDSGGRPVPGAVVKQRNSDGRIIETKTTNKRGEARFRRVVPGVHEFLATHDTSGMRGMFGNFSIEDDDEDAEEEEWMTISVVDGETSRLKLVVPGFASVEGLVTSNGRPLVGATVTLMGVDGASERLSEIGGAFGRMMASGGLEDVTNDQGRYEISDVPAGEYQLVVRHPDRAMPATLDVRVREGDNRHDAALALTSIEGRVVTDGGEPVSGARIVVRQGGDNVEMMNVIGQLDGPFSEFMSGADDWVTSGPDGSFVVHGVAEETSVFVVATRDGYMTGRSGALELERGELRAGVKIELLRAGSVRVRVVGGGGPFRMVEASFAGESEEGALPAKYGIVRNGEAVIDGLREGPWKIHMSNDDSGENERVVEIVPGEEASVTISAGG